MKISVSSNIKSTSPGDMAVFFVPEGISKTDQTRLNQLSGGIFDVIQNQKLIKPKHGSVYITPTLGKTRFGLAAFVGIGVQKDLDLEKIRKLGGAIVQSAKACQVTAISIDFGRISSVIAPDVMAQALVEGLELGNYEYKHYKTVDEDKFAPIDLIDLISADKSSVEKITHSIANGELAARATNLTRDLVNHPPAHIHPKTLRDEAQKIANASSGQISLKVFDRAQLTKMGAGAILGVAQGSEHEPFLLHLEYNPKSAKKNVALVGKGVTFDSGGLSLKPSEHMEDMKMDMAGAAVVLGVFAALPDLKPAVRVHGICVCVENMPSDRAMRVGDILKTMSGKTVEVLNTDAEGRLILADALYYAEQQKPDVVLDFATLTGACMVALGHKITGLFSNDENLIDAFEKISQTSGEMVCRLPLIEEYKEEILSEVADLQNSPKARYGGAITAALFLQEFVQSKHWAHFDIAGPAFCRKPCNSYTPAGGTGWGVRSTIEWLKGL